MASRPMRPPRRHGARHAEPRTSGSILQKSASPTMLRHALKRPVVRATTPCGLIPPMCCLGWSRLCLWGRRRVECGHEVRTLGPNNPQRDWLLRNGGRRARRRACCRPDPRRRLCRVLRSHPRRRTWPVEDHRSGGRARKACARRSTWSGPDLSLDQPPLLPSVVSDAAVAS